jgi:WD40 repeat protein
VALVDIHNDHHVIIHNIKKNKQLLHIEGSKDKIISVAWSKKADDLRFVTVGLRELKFWNPADATKRLSTKGTAGTKGQTNFTSATFDVDGTCYSAGANGSIYVWDQLGQLDQVLKVHTGEVSAIIHDQGKLISGGRDSKIIVHSTKGGEFTLENTFEIEGSHPKSLDYFNGKILVGLRNGSIWEINESTGDKKLLLASHHEGESWGLELIPEDKTIMTVGDDNKVMVFDYANRRFVK